MQGGNVVALAHILIKPCDENYLHSVIRLADFLRKRNSVKLLHLNIEQENVEAAAFLIIKKETFGRGKALDLHRVAGQIAPLINN